MNSEKTAVQPVRLDKWLWAARFFKTRSLAAKEVSSGHVLLAGNRVKPARTLAVGDKLDIRIGYDQYTVMVLDLSERRGPATVARLLYEETESSRTQRELLKEQRLLANSQGMRPEKKPEKHERRRIRQFLKKE